MQDIIRSIEEEHIKKTFPIQAGDTVRFMLRWSKAIGREFRFLRALF